MLAANSEGKQLLTFEPVEYVPLPEKRFKICSLKTSELHPEANITLTDEALAGKLKQAALDIFKGFDGVGYARHDFRMGQNG